MSSPYLREQAATSGMLRLWLAFLVHERCGGWSNRRDGRKIVICSSFSMSFAGISPWLSGDAANLAIFFPSLQCSDPTISIPCIAGCFSQPSGPFCALLNRQSKPPLETKSMVRPVIRVPFTEESARIGGAPTATEHHRSNSASRLMSKVPSLLFDMEDAEDTPVQDALGGPAEGEVVTRLHALLDPWTDQEYMLKLHVKIAADEAAKRGEEHLTVAELADTLRKLGYSVKIRTALGGGWGGACLRNLRHSFLAVTLTSPNAAPPATTTTTSTTTTTVLVDPRFREQFEIAHATPRYARILTEVPPELVTPTDRLSKAVELLCTEMAIAFAATGTPVPPWRQTAAMLSKWQPRRSEEVDVSRGMMAIDAAAALNNAIGGAGCHPTAGTNNNNTTTTTTTTTNGFHHHHQKMTGGNTVAQKLAMLGVEPAHASPISEGLEELESWSMGSGSGDEEEQGGRVVAMGVGFPLSSSSSHSGGEEEIGVINGGVVGKRQHQLLKEGRSTWG